MRGARPTRAGSTSSSPTRRSGPRCTAPCARRSSSPTISPDAGRPPGWLSVPLVLTSHTWENAQERAVAPGSGDGRGDAGRARARLARAVPADSNTAAAVVERCYRTRGQIWTLVVPKASAIPDLFTRRRGARAGARRRRDVCDWAGHGPSGRALVLTAVGAYQLIEALRASERLRRARRRARGGLPARARALPRAARGARGRPLARPPSGALFPAGVPARVFLTHTRPETLLGALGPLHTGRTVGLGFANQGGTLDIAGMLFVNGASWAHAVEAAARLLGLTGAGCSPRTSGPRWTGAPRPSRLSC